jgi:hypothetical protein
MAVALSVHGQTATGTAGASAPAAGASASGTTTVQGTGRTSNRSENQQQNSRPNIRGDNFGNNNPDSGNSTRPFNNNRAYPNYTNQTYPPGVNGPRYGATNQYSQLQTNITNFGPRGTNSNLTATNSPTYNASITNTLATMSPQQAQNVVQVQAGLNALQQVAINLGGVQNVTQIIQQNPQIQTQLQQVETQIQSLAHGPVKPTPYIVDRLATDLLTSCARARLNPNQQLVLAIVINEMANSGTMNAGQIETAVNTALENIEGAGVPRSVSHTVGCDLHSIAYELQPNIQLQ